MRRIGNAFDGFLSRYNFTDFHELNLDWLILKMIELNEIVENFVSLNTIKYADPIQWNITSQYEKNVVVIDPATGTAYLSTKPVPSGVAITNTDYWTVIFTLNILSANQNITLRDDGSNVLATFGSTSGDWLLWNGTLYKVTQTINVNEAYVVGYNITRYTIELFMDDLESSLTTIINAVDNKIGELSNLNTTTKTNLVNAINEVLSKSSGLNIYNILDYGIVDDGADQYSKFIDLMATIDNNGGGIIYVPKGTYITSNTIPIPGNVIMFGDGKESIIYFDGTDPFMGTTVMPAGDDIYVTNISFEYIEADKTDIKIGSQLGSVGITNRRFVANEDAKNFPNGSIKNITFDHIFTTNSHPYNIEPETTANIDNCILCNCNFENGEIYINPLSPADSIHNAKILTCSCKGLVIGSGYNTNGSIIIDGLYTHYARITDKNVIINNMILDAKSYTRGGTTPNYSMQINGDYIILNDIFVKNDGELIDYGISITSSAGLHNKFNNVIIDGYTTNYYDNVGRDAIFTNCDFGSNPISYIHGRVKNSNIVVDSTSDCSIDTLRTDTISLATNLSFVDNSNVLSIYENTVNVCAVIASNKTLVSTSSIGTLPAKYYPGIDQYISGYYIHNDVMHPITFKISSSGYVFVDNTFGSNVVAGDTVFINGKYVF